MPTPHGTLNVGRRKRPLDTSKLVGIAGVGTTTFFKTAIGGGEAGVSTGFGGFVLARLRAAPSTASVLFARSDNAAAGWMFSGGANAMRMYIVDSGGFKASGLYTFTASDVGKLFLFWSPVTNTLLRFFSGPGEAASTATSGFVPFSGSTTLGHDTTAATAFDIVEASTYRGTPTDSDLRAFADSVRTNGTMPAAVGATALTHRWSVRSALLSTDKRGQPVSWQIAPQTLADTITGATADVMTRQAVMPMVVIDPSTRTRYGVVGAVAGSVLDSAAGGITGSGAGFWIALRINPANVTTSSAVVVSRENAGGTQGFSLYIASALFRFFAANGSSYAIADGTIPSQQAAAPIIVLCRYSGGTNGTLRVSIEGVDGTPVTLSGTYTQASGVMRIGAKSPDGSIPASNVVVYEVKGGNYAMSDSEAYDFWAQAAGSLYLPDVPGKTEHTYNVSLDVIANGGPSNGVPAQILDRAGTSHLARSPVTTASSATGLAGFSASSFAATTVNGVTPGAAAGFYAEALGTVATVAGQQAWFAATSDAGFTTGFNFTNNGGKLQIWGGGGSVVSAANMSLGLHHVALRYDGSVLRGYLDGTLIGTSAAYTHTPSNVATTLGGARGTSLLWPTTTDSVRGAAYGAGAVTDGQIATAASAALSAGKIVGIAGVTNKMWSLVDDIAAAPAGTVPQRYVERLAGGSSDVLWLVSNKLEVSTRIERGWSYETSAIVSGAESLSLTDYFEAAVNALPGSANGFVVSLLGVVTSQAVTGGRQFSQRGSTNPGWEFLSQGNNGSVAFSCGGSASALAATTIAATEVGKLGLYTGVYDPSASSIRLYARRVQAATAGLSTGFTPDTTVKAMLGRRSSGNPALGFQIYGAYYALGIPTAAQVTQQFDLVHSTERIQPIAALGTGVLIDLLQDTSGGAVPATLSDRGAGGVNFSRIGAPTLASAKARAWTW